MPYVKIFLTGFGAALAAAVLWILISFILSPTVDLLVSSNHFFAFRLFAQYAFMRALTAFLAAADILARFRRMVLTAFRARSTKPMAGKVFRIAAISA